MSRKTLYGVVAILLIVSGAAGLAYQIVWFKYLALFLGNTTYAQMVVLATFMGGLAIGASLWGRRADRTSNPLNLYALLELGIGIYCLFYPWFLNVLKGLFVHSVRALELPSDGATVLFLKLLISLASLLFPTILMGGTLPVLVRFLSRRIEESGKTVATLYFLNSFGAVIGSLLGGFFLIPSVGLSLSIHNVAIVTIVVGVIALLLPAKSRSEGTASPKDPLGLMVGLSRREKTRMEATEEGEAAVHEFSDRQVFFALLTAGVSGFAAMVYEMTWVRLLIPVLGSSTYSYTLMLVGFITGITIGSWIVSLIIQRVRDLVGFLAFCQLGVALSMLATLPLYGRIPYYFWLVGSTLSHDESTYPIYLSVQFLFGFAIMIVPTIFLGMTLPVASRIASKSMNFLGRSVGNVFSINTLGTVLGTVVAGLLLIPFMGVKHAIEVGVGLNVVVGLVLLFSNDRLASFRKTGVLVGSLVATAAYFVIVPDWNQSVMVSGVFRHLGRNKAVPRSFQEFQHASEAQNVLFYREGTTATVAVTESKDVTGSQRVLFINGKADASSRGDLPTQVLLGQLPLMLHPQADTALVIGLGSGVTLGSILTHPVKFVDCIEISPEVIEASKYFEDVNNHPLKDERVRLTIDDALAFLKLTQRSYDVLVSEPSNPWIAGIGNLFTKEFFEECRSRLRPRGLMVQWFHLYEMDDETFHMVLRTFQSVFPFVTVWQPLRTDVILIGSNEALALNPDLLDDRMGAERVRADLARIQIHDVASLLSLQRLSEDGVSDYLKPGPFNSEDHPLLEYWAPRAFFVNRGVAAFGAYDERMTFGGSTTLLKKRLQMIPLNNKERLNIGQLHSSELQGNAQFGFSILADYLADHPKDIQALKLIAVSAERLGRKEESLRYRERLLQLRPDDYEVMGDYAWLKFQYRRAVTNALGIMENDESERLLKRCIELAGDSNYYYRTRLADLYYGVQDYPRAAEYFEQAHRIRKDHHPDLRIRDDILLLQFARSLYHIGQFDRAIGYALQASNSNQNNEDARDLVHRIWTRGNKGTKDPSTVHP